MDFLEKLFDTDFMPHGHCYFWKPAVLWTNVLGDGVIALAYFLIPVLLVRFLNKRRDIRFRGIFYAFAAFILACGTTHVIAMIAVWHPMYRLEGLVKVITAVISAGTLVGMVYYFPAVLNLPTPEQWSMMKKQAGRSEHRFKTLMEQAPIGVAITSLEGDFLEVNGTMGRLFNYDVEELKALNFRDVTHPDDIGISISQRDSLAKGEKTSTHFEKRYRRKDGTYFWAMVSATAVPEERCHLVHVVDITQRKEAEMQVKEDNLLLEAKVKERTQALAETNKDLENFIYAITHDLRVPMQNLSGLSAELQEELAGLDGGSEDAYSILEMIGENAIKMDSLVVDLLAFSRVGRKELVKKPVDMNALAVAVFDELTQKREADKAIFVKTELPAAFGDAAALRQVVYNLLSNALKYSSKKENPRIEMSGWLEGGKTVYEVKDNGVGFDVQYSDKLFTLFQRLHGAEEFEGTGVGLAASHRLVQKHGGEMWGAGIQGEGAVFGFSLPYDDNFNLHSKQA